MGRIAIALLLLGSSIEAAGGESKRLRDLLLAPAKARPVLYLHVGCGDGRLTAELAMDGRNVIHALTADAAQVQTTRKYLQSKGLYGKASVAYGSMRTLPYVDNLANVIVVEGFGAQRRQGLTVREILRVLAPYGVVYWPMGSYLPSEMEVGTAQESDIISHSPGMRVPADEPFFDKLEHATVVVTLRAQNYYA